MTVKKRKTKLKKHQPEELKKAVPKKTAMAKKNTEKKISRAGLDQEMVSAYRADKVERDKRMILWAGVSFFMILILVVWIFSFKKVLKKINAQSDRDNNLNWTEITNDFSQTMDKMKQGLAEVKNNNPEAESNANNKLPENQGLEINREEITQLKTRLEELEKKMEGENEQLPTAEQSNN